MGKPDDSVGTDETVRGAAPGLAARPGGESPLEPLEAPAERDLIAGTAVGEYVLESVLGRGGFGVVYRAAHPLIGKRVAIKVLSKKFSADDDMVSRFISEARAVNQIRHRNIIDIFSFGALPDGRQYYVMELLEGEPLDAYLAKQGPLALETAVPILRAVARALDAAHAKGVAHRDLKPENIFLARDDDGQPFPKLLDFGIAKLSGEHGAAHKTNTGVPIGTPYYMSPEQCRGQGVDHRTDIYSLGVVTYRLLTGSYPFEGALVDILHKHVYDPPKPPSQRRIGIAAHVDEAVLWMMRKDPAERPSSATAAVAALQGDAVIPSQPAISASNVPQARSRGWIAGLVALVVAAAAAAVVFVVLRGGDDQRPVSEPVAAPPPAIDAAATVAVEPPDAAAEATHVIVTVTGVPEGTEVFVGKDAIGTAPGPVQLPRGASKVVLTFKAKGFVAQSKTIVPSADQDLAVKLKRQPVAGRPPPKDGGDDDVIHVFGKETP